MNEKNKQKNLDEILLKWSKLQKVIKEGVILKKVIIEQQKIDFNKLKKNFIEYYDIKLNIRKTYEEIESLKNKNIMNKQIIFEKNVNYNDKLKSISELLFFFRNNYDYIIKLVDLIEINKDINNYTMHSVIELFCNQFYDNILIPNPEQEELLILIYKLIEKDIYNMNNIYLDNFMDKTTFLSKFIKSLMRKSDIKIFLSKLLAPLILSIEEYCYDLDLLFYEFDNDANNKEENEIFMEFIDKLSIKNENREEKIDNVNDNNNDKNDLFEKLFEKTLENIIYPKSPLTLTLISSLHPFEDN